MVLIGYYPYTVVLRARKPPLMPQAVRTMQKAIAAIQTPEDGLDEITLKTCIQERKPFNSTLAMQSRNM